MRVYRLSMLLLLIVLLDGGCATHVTPPSHPADPVTVYLTDYGRHSSIVLPVSAGGYDEYAFGDWDWFAMGKTNFWVGARAVIASPLSTLGRRHVQSGDRQLVLSDLPGCVRLMEFQVERSKAGSLAAALDQRFQINSARQIHSDFSGLDHIPDKEFYWFFHNCNHVTARWLREVGCKTSGPSILSNFILKPVVPESSEPARQTSAFPSSAPHR